MASYGSPATTLLQMSKQQWEVDAKEGFVRFLQEQYRQAYLATAENVVTNPATRRDFDYELTAHIAGLPVIALEIFRIVGDERDLGHHRAWNDVVQRLTKELKDKDVSGYLIRTPHFNASMSLNQDVTSSHPRRPSCSRQRLRNIQTKNSSQSMATLFTSCKGMGRFDSPTSVARGPLIHLGQSVMR